VQLEPQGPEPLGERVPQPPGLFLGVAVDNNVVRLCRAPDYADAAVNVLVRALTGLD
jgi:hypothetical protein